MTHDWCLAVLSLRMLEPTPRQHIRCLEGFSIYQSAKDPNFPIGFIRAPESVKRHTGTPWVTDSSCVDIACNWGSLDLHSLIFHEVKVTM